MNGAASVVPVLVIGPAGSGRSHRLAVEAGRAESEGATARVVDDIDRADDIVLDELLSAVEGGATVLVSRREPPPPDRPALQRLGEAVARRGRVIELGPASEDEVAVVAARHLDRAVPSDLVPFLRHLTGGNLGLVAAVASAWRIDGPPADPEVGDIPAALRLIVASRWATLASPTLALLDLLAVTGPVPDADIERGHRCRSGRSRRRAGRAPRRRARRR